jgi:hypothetical protein
MRYKSPNLEDEAMIEIVCICCGVELPQKRLSALSHEQSMCEACSHEVEALKLFAWLEETLPAQFRIS